MIKILKFGAEWCKSCEKFDPILDKVVSNRDDVELQRIDVEQEPDLVARYGVKGVPFTVLQSEDGSPLGGFSGILSVKDLNAVIDNVKRGL